MSKYRDRFGNPTIYSLLGRNLTGEELATLAGSEGNIEQELDAKLPDAGTTGGTSTAYTATLASRPNPLTSGYTFVVVFHTTNGAAATIALSGGTAQPIWANGAAAPAGAIIAGTPYVCRSDGTRVHLIGTLGVLGTTSFLGPGGGVMVVTGDSGLCPATTNSFSSLSGGTPGGAGSYVQTYGDAYGYGASGCVMLGAAPGVSGAKIQCYDKNGAEQLRVDENGLTGKNYQLRPWDTHKFGLYGDGALSYLQIVAGDYDNLNGGQISLGGNSLGSTPGWVRLYAGQSGATVQLSSYNSSLLRVTDAGTKIDSQYTDVSIPTGGAWTTLCAIDGNQTLRFATVTGHGTILLEWDGTTLTKLAGVASLVVSGSPSGTEIGFRVSGGNLQASNGTGTSRNGSSGFSVQH